MSPSPETGRNRLECRTCPYQCAIEAPLFSRRTFKRKEREDVFGGPGAWDNADKTAAQCPATGCDGAEAAFYQIQIRSADEPMTSFFKVRPPLPPVCFFLCLSFSSHRIWILLTYLSLSSSLAVYDVWTPLAGELVNLLERVPG